MIEAPEIAAHHRPTGGGEPSDPVLWHAAAATCVVAGGASLLLAVDGVAVQVLLALGFMSLPGMIGAFWRPKAEERFALLALWALGAALAVCVCGGLSGPLAVFCVTPALACLVVGASWREGAGLCIATVVFCAFVGVLRLPPPAPAEPTRAWLTLIALLITAVLAGGALLVARRRAEDEREDVLAELAAFQSLMGDLPDLALAMDAQGRTEAVFGQPLDGLDSETLHPGLLEAATPADRPKLQAAMAQALESGAASAGFAPLSAPDQRLTVALQRTGAGGLTAILRKAPAIRSSSPASVVIASSPLAGEITERLNAAENGRREAEIGRDKAEANATARARFLANMSHELRTPLNAIMGFSDMMRAKMFGELPPKYAEYAELIHESGGHLLDLINDVLDMSKIEAQRYTLSREVFDIRDALNAALRLMRLQADDAGVKLRAVLPAEPLMVDADKRAIKQIALNLLSNALKFTPKDGTVILTARAAGPLLELVVADTGMGIAEDDLRRLGQPFEQAGGAQDRARGTGLGLSLVDAFAKLHGGAMSLESRLGEGTAATVRLPVLVSVDAASEVQPELTPLAVLEAAQPKHAPPAPPAPEPSVPNTVEQDAAFLERPAKPSAAARPSNTSANDPFPPDELAPFNARAADHHELKQSVLTIFKAPRGSDTGEGFDDPSPDRPNNGGVKLRT